MSEFNKVTLNVSSLSIAHENNENYAYECENLNLLLLLL